MMHFTKYNNLIIHPKENGGGSGQEQDEKDDAVAYWMLTGVAYMEILKKRPFSEKSGDFGHLILSRKHRTKEEPTK